jgi:hypothetical protein
MTDHAAILGLLAAVQAVLTCGIFVLSIRWGVGGLSRTDRLLIAIAGGGVIAWLLAGEPLVATACVIVADVLAAAMVPKTYREPESETLVTFALASVGGGLAAGAVGALDASLLLYPVYYCLVNGAIALPICVARARAVTAPAPVPALVR